MERNELHPQLQAEYDETARCGVERVNYPKVRGLWFVVPPPPPRAVAAETLPAEPLARAAEAIATQPSIAKTDRLDQLVSYLFLRKEAVESSRIEGTMSTIDHALTPGEVFDGYQARTEGAAVRGYAMALESRILTVPKKGLSIFSVDLIQALHRETLPLDPSFRGVPGKLRESTEEVVVIRGRTRDPRDSIYNPTPPRHVSRCLAEVMTWFRDRELATAGDAGLGMPLCVRMAIGHAHFEAVHPFTDGNGRVGRMLLALQMACSGRVPLYLSGFIEEEKSEYGRVLQAAQKKLDYAPLIGFIAEAVTESGRESAVSRAALLDLPSLWRKRAGFRSHSTAARALEWLVENPIFTAPQIQNRFKVSHEAANQAAASLCRAGIARERTGFGRNRVFAAEEVIAILARRFGSPVAPAVKGARELMRSRSE